MALPYGFGEGTTIGPNFFKQLQACLLSLGIPNTQTGGTYTQLAADTSIIANSGGTLTLTLLSAASVPGHFLFVKTIANQAVASNASNVVPLIGGAAGTAILTNTAGKWAVLQSDGTNWVIMAGN